MSDRQILQTIGRNLQKARLRAGLTQECLAEMADIHWKTLGYVETGKRSIGIASFAKIVQALQIDPSSLFEGLPRPNRQRFSSIEKALKRKRI